MYYHLESSPICCASVPLTLWDYKQSSRMTTYCCLGCKCLGSCVCTLTCGDGGVGTGLRVELAIGSGGDASVLGRCFCSEATRRAICSWLPLSCSAILAICSWLALSCSAKLTLSRAICACAVLR